MSEVKFKIDASEFERKTISQVERGLRAVTLEGADLIKQEHRESPATGRVYKKGKSTFHRASAAGEPPAVDTGRLINSIFGGVVEKLGYQLKGKITVNTEYALSLEKGTEKIAARPFIFNTISQNWNDRLMPLFRNKAK